ncbi:MAG: Wzz/FepE/Etk N-terminal domain-containing protein [Steroidobacteraceae bacterium]
MNIDTENWDEESSIDLRELFVRFWQKRWWIISSVVVCATAFTVAAFTITPVYRVTALLVPVSSERGSNGILGAALGQLGGLASLAGIGLKSGDSETEEALAVLRSRQFTESFIRDKQLMPVLFPKNWDSVSKKWKVANEDQPTSAKAYKYFNETIRAISQDKKTGLIALQIDWKDRNEAAVWANELVQRLNAEMRARAIAKADASVGFLQKELMSTSDVGTREAINRLIEAQIKQRMLANVTQEYAFRVVDKALAPDADDPIWPKKMLMIVFGPLFGLILGVVVVFAFTNVLTGKEKNQ